MFFGVMWIDILIIASIIVSCILAYRAKALTLLGAVFAFFLTVRPLYYGQFRKLSSGRKSCI